MLGCPEAWCKKLTRNSSSSRSPSRRLARQGVRSTAAGRRVNRLPRQPACRHVLLLLLEVTFQMAFQFIGVVVSHHALKLCGIPFRRPLEAELEADRQVLFDLLLGLIRSFEP